MRNCGQNLLKIFVGRAAHGVREVLIARRMTHVGLK